MVTSEQDQSINEQSIIDESKNTAEVGTAVKENATEKITTSAEQSVTSTLKESSDPENVVENTITQTDGTTSQGIKNSYQDSLEKVEEINAAANATIQDAIDKFTQEIDKIGGTVTIKPGNQVVINTTVNGIEVSKTELEKHIKDQIANLDKSLNEYKTKLETYSKELADYNDRLHKYEEAKAAYIAKLEEMGLWNDQNVDLDDIKQDLVLSEDEVNTKVEADVLHGNVTIKPDTLLNSNLPFLDNLANINNNQTITGDFLKLTYTGFEKSYYGNDLIGKIEITFSDWVPAKTSHKFAGIYYGDKLTDGFFYTKGEGVTMEMKVYDKNGKQITIKPNSAYITVGSLNSEGEGNDYVEKAEIINGADHRGEGVAIPGSSVGVHKGEGQYGGDILYSDLNNEILNYLNSGGNRDKAIEIWGVAIVEEFENWDSTTNRDKEIFGCGLFNVSGNSIKIRFSNKLGSAWATYSTTVPKLAFQGTHPGKAPEKPSLEVSYSPGSLVLNKNSSVHIHYVDVSGVKDTTNYEPGMGEELKDQLQSIIDLAVGDSYNNILWNWEEKGYILATSPSDIHPGATNGTIADDEKHYYVYLTHKITTSTEDTSRDKVVNQVIHYEYEDGSTAAPDHVSLQLVFTQTGTKITTVNAVTSEIIVTYDWNGEWSQTQSFVTVKSPTIQGFHTDRLEVGPYDITVTNDNYDQNLDKEDTVVYKANPTETVNRDKVVNQVIHYEYEDGSTAAPDHVSVQLVFTQTGTRDTITGEIIWDGEWSQTQSFVTVKSPTIQGFHTDRLEVGPYDITVTNDNYGENLDKEDTVVYKANPTETVNRDKVVNQVIHYEYEDGSTAAPDHVSVQLVFTQTGTRDTITGEIIWDGEWTQNQSFVTVKSPTIQGFHTDRLEVGPYDITVTNDNYDQNLDKEDTVVYKANPTETVNRDKVVNQVIHYVYEDGSTAAPDHVSIQLVFSQTGTKDTITGETIWDGEWTQTQSFVTVKSPTIQGFHTDRLEVGPYDITVTNDNYDQNLDKEDTVVYKANPVIPDPEDPKPDTPDPEDPKPDTPDPEDPKPDTPDPEDPKPDTSDPEDPTPDTADSTPDMEEEFAPPLPEYPDRPEKEETTVPPHASEKPGAEVSSVAPVKAVTVSKETPETVSTKVVEETQETLPKTGEHDKSKMATFFGALASVLGITSLAGAKKRKKDE